MLLRRHARSFNDAHTTTIADKASAPRFNSHIARANLHFGMEPEALPVHHVTHVRANFPAGPELERFVDDQIADAIVALDELRDFRRRLRCGNVFFGLRGLRKESHPRHILREHGNDRQPKSLIQDW